MIRMSVVQFIAATALATSIPVPLHAADESACTAARYAAAGKYATCEAKALQSVPRNISINDSLATCRQRYAAAWPKLQAKFPGTTCALARFVEASDTVTDNLTGLVWEKKTAADSVADPLNPHDSDNTYTWSAASSDADGTAFSGFLTSLNSDCFAGQCDWRLPTSAELQTILLPEPYPCTQNPCVDPAFLPNASNYYWSSTTDAYAPDSVRGAWFVNANSETRGKIYLGMVRAVRGGL